MAEWYENRYPKKGEKETPKSKAITKRIPRPAPKKLEWDSSLQDRISSLDDKTRHLADKVDEFIEIHDLQIKTARNESINEIETIRKDVTDIVEELKSESHDRNTKLEKKLSEDFGEQVGAFEDKVRDIETNLEEVERRLFEGANEVGLIKSRVESKNIKTKVDFLDEQIGNTAELLSELKAVLRAVNSKSYVGLERRMKRVEERLDTSQPIDIAELRMRIDGLEKALGNKDTLKKIKALSDRLEELEERRHTIKTR